LGYAAGSLIGVSQVDRRIRVFQALFPEHGLLRQPPGSWRREFALMLADEALLLAEAGRRGIKVPEDEVREAARAWWGSLGRSSARVSLGDLEDYARRQLTVNRLQLAVTAGIRVTRDQVYEYYQRHPEEFTRPAVAKVLLIQVATPGEAEELAALVRRGEDFASLAARHSLHPASRRRGGDLGWIWEGEGKLPEEVEKFLWPELLRRGPGMWVISGRYGRAFLVRVEEYRPPRLLDYEEVEMDLQTRLVRERKEELWQKFVGGLREKHRIIWFWPGGWDGV
jgi:peptidyl-prolyl cis-trans isomerase C